MGSRKGMNGNDQRGSSLKEFWEEEGAGRGIYGFVRTLQYILRRKLSLRE
jgi:hypothetical protein